MNILITTLSLIQPKSFKEENYDSDLGNFTGWFTNEAPSKYLIKLLFTTTYSFFDRIIVLASKECLTQNYWEDYKKDDDVCRKAKERINGRTTAAYYQDVLMDYMIGLYRESKGSADSEKLPDVLLSSEKIFRMLEVNIDSDDIRVEDLMRECRVTGNGAWEANLYMDYTGGMRWESLTGMLAMRCLDAAGYQARKVIYSYHDRQNEEKHRIVDMTPAYRRFDSVIAQAMLTDPNYLGEIEDKMLILKNQGMELDPESEAYGESEEDRRNYAPSFEGTPYIFLSYAHKDMLFAQSFLKNMRRRGVTKIWYDRGIKPTSLWDKVLKEKMSNCGMFIVLASKNYNMSSYCHEEIEFAKDHNKAILVIYLDVRDIIIPEKQGIILMDYLGDQNGFYERVLSTPDINLYT